jgi:hypothetical protein
VTECEQFTERKPTTIQINVHTGIKHFASNKARIPGQGEYMDANPCMIIVPILTCERVKNRHGEAYDAIVVIDGWTTDNRQHFDRPSVVQ